jgi:hypothetical protein
VQLYCPAFTNEPSDVDMNQHCDVCHALLNTFLNTTSCLKGLCTDGCSVYCSTCDQNVMFLAKESLHFMMELEHNLPHVMWAGMTAACMNVSVVDLIILHLTEKC